MDLRSKSPPEYSWQEVVNVMTPKRYELLFYLHESPVRSIMQLARELKRSYRRVYYDVIELQDIGLIMQKDKLYVAAFDSIIVNLHFGKD